MDLLLIIREMMFLILGGIIGAAWGLSRYTHLYDWFSANFISRMSRAMRSCGYEQWKIDMVIEHMGMRIMPPYIPAPKPPEKKSFDAKPPEKKSFDAKPPEKKSLDVMLSEKHIAVLWRGSITDDDIPVIEQLCLDFADRMRNAATHRLKEDLDNLEITMCDEWIRRGRHDYGIGYRNVRIEYAGDEPNSVSVYFDVK